RLDFDPARASALAIAQVLLCTVVVVAGGRKLLPESSMVAGKGTWKNNFARAPGSLALDTSAIMLTVLIVVPPLAAIIINGVSSLPAANALVKASFTSLFIGIASAVLALILSMPLAYFGARTASESSRRFLTLLSLSAWMLPPAVIATGWFIALLPFHFGGSGTALLVVAMNALMALPFVYGGLAAPVAELTARDDRLCASLGIRGLSRLRLIDLPSLRAPLVLAGAMAFAVSLGDLTAITLFGSGDIQTLPALIYRQMGSYRMADSTGTALFLAASSFAVMWFAEFWARKT
ncbi:MAG: thiamine/thiamine pyrophosphate ABC transporter permease ThiP, partial [Aestuariivirga sp.]